MAVSSTALIGFACDEGVRRNNGRPGAINGPKAIREQLKKNNIIIEDLGDVECVEQDLESAQIRLGEKVSEALQNKKIPIVLGGGHETAWGHYQGIEKHLQDKKLGIVNFDAHFDLRPLIDNKLGSSGTPFLQIANACKANNRDFHYSVLGVQPSGNSDVLFETAKELRVQYQYAQDIHEQPLSIMQYWLEKRIEKVEKVYLSICLDVFAQSVAPGVSAPQPFGLMPWQVLGLVEAMLKTGKVMAVDIVELAPNLDVSFQTSKLAAGFVQEIFGFFEVGS